jgi:hypothetical protein
MNHLPGLPPKSQEHGGGELTEAQVEKLLRSSRRHSRRQKAARAALDLAGTTRLIAQSELWTEAANAVQESWPRDRDHLEQVLWPSLSKYSATVFDKIAEVRLEALGSSRLI